MADYAEAQASVLGSMLIDPKTVPMAINSLQPTDFDAGLNQDIFCAFRSLFLLREAIDPVTVLARLGARTSDARSYVHQLMDITPTAANISAYIDIVKTESRLTAIKALGLELAMQGNSLGDARDIVAKLQGLMVDHSGVESLSMEQGLLNFYDELDQTPSYIPWGMEVIDDVLTAESGDFVILGGYPSDGKTALALHLAYSQAETLNVGFFSLETKSSKLFNRLFASVAGVGNKRLKQRTLTAEDNALLAARTSEVRERKLELIKASSMTVADIRAYSLARRFDVIYIDYLTLIPDDGRTDYDKATNISRALHAMAQDCGITVVALSQLTRPEKSKGGKQQHPTMSSVRSSGQIEQDADVILLLYREEPDKLRSRRILRLAKNKEGETGTWPLAFDGDLQRFTVVPPSPGEQYASIQREIRAAVREANQQVRLEELPMDTPIPIQFGGDPRC